ncbi:hypothetical protein BH23ACT10_BH23ACT10_29480 [soil metagenome]
MRRVPRLLTIVFALLMVVALAPAAAADPGSSDPDGQGGAKSDEHSKNMKLMANVPKDDPDVTQSDLAFDGKYAYAGNYAGFRVIDISSKGNPKVVAEFACNGAQGDVSVYEGLLFRSVDSPQSEPSCDSTTVTASTPGMFEGVQIFDVSNPRKPELITMVPTDCGSHTNTLVPDPENDRVFVYVSSYPLGGRAIGPDCQEPHGYISIIEVPLDDPAAATVSKYFLDEDTELATYDLDAVFGTPPGTSGTYEFTACHDIGVFVELGLAASACLSEAQLWDISDPANPEFLWRYDNDAIDTGKLDLFHNASFSWDGEVVAFADESGGGAFPRCTDPDDDQGRIWFVDTETGEELASYKIPRSVEGTCTAHNFNFVPLRDGRKVVVSAWYTGGTSVVDVDALLAGASSAEAEIGYYVPENANTWSSYWYDGFIYTGDINRGTDIMLLRDKARAGARKLRHLNPQTQVSVID